MAEDVYTRPGPTNDIYESLTHLNPGTIAQHGDSGESKKNVYRAAAVCLGLMCLLLLAVIIGLVVHNQLQTRQNQSSWDELHTRYKNLTEERDDLKKRLCGLPGWQQSVYGCYYISTEEKTWEESRQYCRDNYSDLMVIKTKEEQDFVNCLNQRVWLGLTDRETEGTFVWVDGTPLTEPMNWISGEPNNGEAPNGEENCAEYWTNHRGWNDRSCSDLNQWICERVIY